MGIFSRIGEIINANINGMLDNAKDPEKMARLMIYEMEDTLTEVKSSAAEIIAERIQVERELALLSEVLDGWHKKAELAIFKGRDDLARQALSRKLEFSDEVCGLQKRYDELSDSMARYYQDIDHLEQQLQSAYQRQQELDERRKRVLRDQQRLKNARSAFTRKPYQKKGRKCEQPPNEAASSARERLLKKFRELERNDGTD